jgi:hypothetical protein
MTILWYHADIDYSYVTCEAVLLYLCYVCVELQLQQQLNMNLRETKL